MPRRAGATSCPRSTFKTRSPSCGSSASEKAKEFYVDFLGFTIDWEHRFEGVSPVYMQVSRGNLVLHLSEHYGDCCPGSTVYVPTTGVDDSTAN